jgi:hypothetical protein
MKIQIVICDFSYIVLFTVRYICIIDISTVQYKVKLIFAGTHRSNKTASHNQGNPDTKHFKFLKSSQKKKTMIIPITVLLWGAHSSCMSTTVLKSVLSNAAFSVHFLPS